MVYITRTCYPDGRKRLNQRSIGLQRLIVYSSFSWLASRFQDLENSGYRKFAFLKLKVGERAIDIKLSLLKNDKKVLPALITA